MGLAFAGVVGLIFGSFLNVCIVRLPEENHLKGHRSKCPKCHQQIAWYDNIPILSFVILQGCCRRCAEEISIRYPIVELLGAVVSIIAYLKWGLTIDFAIASILMWAMIVVIFVDFKHQIIPDEITLSGIILGLIVSVAYPAWHGASNHWLGLLQGGLGVLIGGGSLFLLSAVAEWILKKEALGGGDIKFIAAVGAFFGWQGAFFALFLASLAGALAGIFIKFAFKEDKIPFGPYLVLGVIIYLFWGEAIITWYLHSMLQY